MNKNPKYRSVTYASVASYSGRVLPKDSVNLDVETATSSKKKKTHKENKSLKRKINDCIEKDVTFCALQSITFNFEGLDVNSTAGKFLILELQFVEELQRSIKFRSPVCHIYNPLEYAIEPHISFLKKYCYSSQEQKILFIGMNPGPFGMAQTGVPFGEVNMVKDWLNIDENVRKPENEHPKRPINGFDCTRKEVSGARFWGYFQSKCITPEQFFKHSFVYNVCPLVFLNENGKNLTPPDLQLDIRNQLNEICDIYLYKVLQLLEVKIVVGIGIFAQKRTLNVLKKFNIENEVDVKAIMHPSPANPAANKGWNSVVDKQLIDMKLHMFF